MSAKEYGDGLQYALMPVNELLGKVEANRYDGTNQRHLASQQQVLSEGP